MHGRDGRRHLPSPHFCTKSAFCALIERWRKPPRVRWWVVGGAEAVPVVGVERVLGRCGEGVGRERTVVSIAAA
jgi:hypothetical protein